MNNMNFYQPTSVVILKRLVIDDCVDLPEDLMHYYIEIYIAPILNHLKAHYTGGFSIEFSIHADSGWLLKSFVRRHRQPATTFNHVKPH